MSPFERPTGSFSTPATGAESGLGGGAAPDGGLIHHAIAPMNGTEAAAGAQMKVAAEAGALSAKAMGAIGHAAMAAIPVGGEPISPLIQLIMKMPGAMGLLNNFFECLFNFFSGENLIRLFDPSFLQHALGSQASMLHNLASGAEHFTVSLASMPGGGGMLNGLGQAARGMGNMDFAKIASTPGEHFMQNPADVGAQADLSNAQFEGAGHVSAVTEGTVAGPSVTHGSTSNYLAGNQRLFSDRIGSGGNFSSVTSATNVPSTGTTIPNSSGATFGQEANALQASPTAQVSQIAQPAIENATTASSSIVDKLGGNNVVASDVGAYRPSVGAYWAPQGINHATAPGAASGGEFIEPLKAKQLSFQDLQKGAASPSKSIMDHIGRQSNGLPGAGNSRMMDGIGHTSLPKAFSTGSGMNHMVHHPSNHISAHQGSHVSSHHVAHHAAPKVEAQPAPKDVAQMQSADQTQIAQGSDPTQVAPATDQAAAPTEAQTYTVQRGDNLWNIAQKNLGDGSKWTEIYKLNSETLGSNPDLIYSGTELKLPGMEQQVADAGKYVVKPGDNLWDISQKQFGDGSKWGDLYKANADVIGDNPRLIMPGQELSMPGANEALAQASPAGATTAQAAVPQSVPTAQAIGQPIPQASFGSPQQGMAMDASSMQQTPVAMQQSAGAMQQAQSYMQQQPQSYMQQAPGAAEAAAIQPAVEGIPVSPQGVIQVQHAHELPPGPGAAGAATLRPASDSIVSSSLAPDLSWIEQK